MVTYRLIESEQVVLMVAGLIALAVAYGLLNALHDAERTIILTIANAFTVTVGAVLLIVWQDDLVGTGVVGFVDDLVYLAIVIGAIRFGVNQAQADGSSPSPSDGGMQ